LQPPSPPYWAAPGPLTHAANNTPADAEDAGNITEVIVTATRREERLLDIPVSTSVLSGAALGSDRPPRARTIRQLAFTVPSLNIESSNGNAPFSALLYPRLRQHRLQFVRLAAGLARVRRHRAGKIRALKRLPHFSTRPIVEVLRGPPGHPCFGRNSPAGVGEGSNPRSPCSVQFSGSAQPSSDGTFNTADFDGMVNIPINDTMAFRALDPRVNTGITGSNAPKRSTGGPAPGRLYDDWAARLQLLYKPSDNFSALFQRAWAHARWLRRDCFRAKHDPIGAATTIVPGLQSPPRPTPTGYNGPVLHQPGVPTPHLTWKHAGVHLPVDHRL